MERCSLTAALFSGSQGQIWMLSLLNRNGARSLLSGAKPLSNSNFLSIRLPTRQASSDNGFMAEEVFRKRLARLRAANSYRERWPDVPASLRPLLTPSMPPVFEMFKPSLLKPMKSSLEAGKWTLLQPSHYLPPTVF